MSKTSIAKKLEEIAKNDQKIYNAGYQKGKTEGNIGYDEGYVSGKQDMNTDMMNAITANGSRTEYNTAFWGEFWNDELFKPQDVIKPTVFNKGMQGSSIENGAYTDLLDFSNCQNLSAAFYNSKIKKLKVIDARKTTSGFNGMANMFYGCDQLESIDEFYPSNLSSSKAAFQNGTFAGCSVLRKLIVKSEISQNGLDLHWSTKLSKESIESIINNLSDTTSGLTVTLSQMAINSAFGDEEWATMIAEKPNWTISLV